MLIKDIINPDLLSLIARVRHTNTIVISDAAFPYWPMIETVDLTLVRGIPTIPQVLDALLPNWKCGEIWMAKEFEENNTDEKQKEFDTACRGIKRSFELHNDFKKRVPQAIGLVRTGDTTAYGNMILESV
ncbi:MAG TPA: transport protein RbsD/FucU [Verrucomicrobiales bacterium]|nr:transport protein RbsD/FucU [Pedosphaera sp.]MBL6844768.1 transport protein RbsD/FucU [Verrucomicrobiae bacterium]HAO66518.1 transport protein RbsD/FucU [Verrucomicrobiales bacterium]HAQ99093.1 transport protein RbsD/FucU [Verrucomicrobiales bacterium]HAW00395.1 transport protein RbsD/FucU [Verrucomicrobiales bacterium]|tara:strand:- start:101 stop:490 length:390 start_codon:yes stop_codon:yes gene_type:complete